CLAIDAIDFFLQLSFLQFSSCIRVLLDACWCRLWLRRRKICDIGMPSFWLGGRHGRFWMSCDGLYRRHYGCCDSRFLLLYELLDYWLNDGNLLSNMLVVTFYWFDHWLWCRSGFHDHSLDRLYQKLTWDRTRSKLCVGGAFGSHYL